MDKLHFEKISDIMKELSFVKPSREYNRYTMIIGFYVLRMSPPDHFLVEDKNILDWEELDVFIAEKSKNYDHEIYIDLCEDPLFKNYEPIQYNVITAPNGNINIGDGRRMPIYNLCELIYYLYRLSNLTAFM